MSQPAGHCAPHFIRGFADRHDRPLTSRIRSLRLRPVILQRFTA
jgi:hypothetical protein